MYPLMTAYKYGHDICLELLLKHGANPSFTESLGFSTLYRACVESHNESVSILLKIWG